MFPKMLKIFNLIIWLSLFIVTSCKKEETIHEQSYSPTSMGSSWTYDGESIESTSNQMTGRTFKKYNKTYFEKSVSTLTDNFSYFGTKDGNNYYSIVPDPNDPKKENEVLYLKSDANIDETWMNEITYGKALLGSQWMYTMKEKGISRVVNGKTYWNVIHTQRISDGFTIDSYYSLGIGLIEVDYGNGGRSVLRDYDIK
jgi:hypothetical protein